MIEKLYTFLWLPLIFAAVFAWGIGSDDDKPRMKALAVVLMLAGVVCLYYWSAALVDSGNAYVCSMRLCVNV